MKMKSFLLLCTLLSSFFPSYAERKIKIYSFYTPSHKQLVHDWFLPSIPSDCEVILEEFPQLCSSAEFMSEGWNQTMVLKIDVIIKGILENWGSYFIHSDVDIQFFAPIKDVIDNLMQGKELLAQRCSPYGDLCAGFFVCRGNKKMFNLFSLIKERIQDNNETNDQIELNRLIRQGNPMRVRWAFLPDSFFAAGMNSNQIWVPGKDLLIPDNLYLHHATWTVGLGNKIEQLEYVKKVQSR